MYRRGLAALAGLLLLIVAPAPAHAGPLTTGAVVGVVLDRGRPAPGITVILSQTAAQTTTDRTGRFRYADLSPGTYSLEYRTPGGGMTQHSEPFTVDAGQTVRETETIGPHGALAGRILDNHGRPAGGALVGCDVYRARINTEADSQGRFLLDYLPPAPCTVYVQRQATGAPMQYVPRTKTASEAVPVPIEVGRVSRIEERLLPLGIVKGTFTGPSGPVDAWLSAVSESDTIGTPTADDGSFQLYLWPGDHRLRFEIGDFGHQVQWATAALDAAGAKVFHVAADRVIRHDERLLANGTIGGRLLDYTGAPLAGPATVELTSTNYETVTATTDSDGYWSASAFPGDYQLRFVYENRRLRTDDTFRLLPGKHTAVPDQTLVQAGDLDVAATLDGEPVQTFCAGLTFAGAGVPDFRECTETGTVHFEGLSPADYYWIVWIGYSSWNGSYNTHVTVASGQLTKTTIAVTTG